MMSDSFPMKYPLGFLSVLATIAALDYAEPLAAPLTLAFVTAIILGPVNDRLRRAGFAPSLAAIATLLAVVVALTLFAMLFQPWITEVIEAWPKVRIEIRRVLVDIRGHLDGLFDIQREMISTIDPEGDISGGHVSDDMPNLSDAAWLAPQVLGQGLLFVGGVFFFLTSKEGLYAVLTDRLGLCPIGACAAAEARVARYFVSVAMTNFGFGMAVAIAMTLIGLPAAPLWGVIGALANFVVFLGPAVVATALIVAGSMTFHGFSVFLPTAVFVGLNTIEGQFVTPTFLGRQMRLSPLLVFISLSFWLWLWGAIGGIVAIPLLLWGQEILGVRRHHDPASGSGASKSDTDASRSAGSKEAGVKKR